MAAAPSRPDTGWSPATLNGATSTVRSARSCPTPSIANGVCAAGGPSPATTANYSKPFSPKPRTPAAHMRRKTFRTTGPSDPPAPQLGRTRAVLARRHHRAALPTRHGYPWRAVQLPLRHLDARQKTAQAQRLVARPRGLSRIVHRRGPSESGPQLRCPPRRLGGRAANRGGVPVRHPRRPPTRSPSPAPPKATHGLTASAQTIAASRWHC
jgi:hypothetical protein